MPETDGEAGGRDGGGDGDEVELNPTAGQGMKLLKMMPKVSWPAVNTNHIRCPEIKRPLPAWQP